MLFGRMGFRALSSAGVAAGIGIGAAGGLGVGESHAAGALSPAATAGGTAIVLIQSGPSTSGSTAPTGPTKEPPKAATPRPKEKQRRLSPCGPGLAPCPGTK